MSSRLAFYQFLNEVLTFHLLTFPGQSNETETSNSKNINEETVVSQLTCREENVIETNKTVQLVNNSNQSLGDITSCEVVIPRPNSNVDSMSDQLQSSGEKTEITNSLREENTEKSRRDVKLFEQRDKEIPNENATVDNNSECSALAVCHANPCTSSVNNVTMENVSVTTNAIERNHALSSSDSNTNQDVKSQVVSNICKAIVRSVSHDIVEDILDKVFNKVEHVEEPQDTIEDSKQTKDEVDETKSKEMDEKIKETKGISDNDADPKEHKETNVESKETIKDECFSPKLSQRSDDYDEIEKSDGSDSGIGSELIDEAITKSSSDSSSSTSSDEFTPGAATSTESWVTPCISFAEMSDIDFGTGPRLSIPTFDDLTCSPCDVFATEKKQSGVSEAEEKKAVDSQGKNSC